MPTYEGLRLKVLKYRRLRFANWRKKQLTNTDFTIISNNCWGGMVYESYNLPKGSPTVGMFFMAEDYIKFLVHLKEYLAAPLSFITPTESRWRNAPEVFGDKRFGSYPIGKLEIAGENVENIELFFLHYHSEDEAREKWERRCERINWDHMLVKFNDQNGCEERHIRRFDALPYKNKVCFIVKEQPKCKSVIHIKAPQSHKFVKASYEPFGAKVTELINGL